MLLKGLIVINIVRIFEVKIFEISFKYWILLPTKILEYFARECKKGTREVEWPHAWSAGGDLSLGVPHNLVSWSTSTKVFYEKHKLQDFRTVLCCLT